MTRGPLPKKAIAAAQDVGAGRGTVLDAAGMQESHHDFTIFSPGCTVFVRVKRIRTHVADPQEIAGMFGEDVHMIRRIPLTLVVAREIWTLSPWDCWQYFLILDDRIIEIRRDGTPVLPAVPAAGENPAPISPVPVAAGNGNTPVPAMAGNDFAPLPGTAVTGSTPPGDTEAPTNPAPAIPGNVSSTSPGTGFPSPSLTVTPG